VDLKTAACVLATTATVLLFAACGTNQTSPTTSTTPPPTTPPPTSNTSSFAVTFGENPVPFRSTGCNASVPQGWYTTARLDEKGGVTFTPSTLIQQLDGGVSSVLAESFNSRFGACAGSPFNPGVIPANGAVCASLGVCTSGSYSNYQFQIIGTDANGHPLTFDSPLLQFGTRPAGQLIPLRESSLMPVNLLERRGRIDAWRRW
jgi:hypothetical protein